MKPFLTPRHLFSLLLGCLLMIGSAFAQPETDEQPAKSDTTEIAWRNKKFIIISDDEGKRIEIRENGDVVDAEDDDEDEDDSWEEEDAQDNDYDYTNKEKRRKRSRSEVDGLALDLGVTNYYVAGTYGVDAASPELELRAFRPGSHVALHLLPTRVSLIGRGTVNLKSAITIDWSNYYFVNDVTLLDGQERLAFDTTGVDFQKNKLTTRYAQIPLMLNINTAPGSDDGVSISVGVYGGILWGAHTKQVSEENGKVRIDGTYNLNPFRYGLMARVDFRWFDIYLNYNLSEMFAENEGPSTQTFTAGINLINF
ncbi:MAG: hypothetical protein OHK0039_02310 [Bacteroidia bacterium]